MHFLNPDHILVFYHVYNAGGIRAATGLLGRTPSTISEAIDKLESVIGEKLFTRAPWAPTTRGAEFYRVTAKPIGDILMAQALTARKPAGPSLRIGTSNHILQEYVVPIVDTIVAHFPDVRVTYRSGPRRSIEGLLCGNGLDLAILTVDEPTPGMMFQELLTLPVMLLAPEGLAIQDTASFLAAEPARVPLVCPPPEDAVTRRFFDLLGRQGIRWPVTHDAGEVALVPGIVARGRAVGPCPRALSLLDRPGVKACPTECRPVTVGAFWCGRLRPVVHALLDVIGQAARNLRLANCLATPSSRDVVPAAPVAANP